jgi:phenylpropionate dioxygenase-like ring-hydroxylating dioxygenase large terminal subunit
MTTRINQSIQPASTTATSFPATQTTPRTVYLRNTWYVAMWSRDLAGSKPLARTLLNEPIVFFRKEDGQVAALTDRCPHRFALLSMGRVLPGDRLECPYHGLQFGADGACVHNPHGGGAIPPAARVRAYPVIEKHSLLWIWMGERPADPSSIPDYSCFDGADPVRVTERDYLRMNASCELVMNNLLDTSHTSYVHAGILGGGDTVTAQTEAREEGGMVTISRVSQDCEIPSMYRDLTPPEIKRTTKWNVMRWNAPSCILIQGGVGGPGDDAAQGWGYDGVHLLTPETDCSVHYHFAAVRWNLLTQDHAHNEGLRQKISAMRRFAFAEQDGPIIEAQQRAIDAAGGQLRPMMLSVDGGLVRCARVLERLLALEQAPAATQALSSS